MDGYAACYFAGSIVPSYFEYEGENKYQGKNGLAPILLCLDAGKIKEFDNLRHMSTPILRPHMLEFYPSLSSKYDVGGLAYATT